MDKGGLKAAVCSKWLHPIDMRGHPAFASWMTYGEPAEQLADASADAQGILHSTCGLLDGQCRGCIGLQGGW